MALDLRTEYPGQIASASGYPYGKPRNESAPGEDDGFPFEEAWVSDLFGFLQSLLHEAPTGTPDTATDSQYLDGLKFHVATILGNVGANGEDIRIEDGAYVRWEDGSHAWFESGTSIYLGLGSTVDTAGHLWARVQSTATIDGAWTWSADNYPRLSSRSLTRVARSAWVVEANSEFYIDADTGNGQFTGTLGYPHAVALKETVESAATLTSVTVYVKGAAHGASWPPSGGLPVLTLYKVSQTSTTSVTLGTKADTSNQATYEDWHPLTIAVASGGTFAANEQLVVSLHSEWGTSTPVTPLEFKTPVLTMTFDELRAV